MLMKPRVGIYYESRLGRNDGNPLYVWNDLKRRQKAGELEVDHLTPDGKLSAFGKYDLNFWVDWGEDGLGGLLPFDVVMPSRPLIYWASDTHLGYAYRMNFAKQSDLTFVAQKSAVDRFKADGVTNVHFLPHAFEPEAYWDQDTFSPGKIPQPYQYLTKKYDVCFVGHINSLNRIEALDRLFDSFPNFYFGQKLFNEAAQKYAQSKIVFNISMLDDLNMRTFEVMGSGAFLLTNDIPAIHDLFIDGKHLVTYKDHDDMIAKARYYIEHDAEREAIAKAGFDEVCTKHTIKHRVDEMLSRSMSLINQEVNV
jgi:O-antigen biosynthesis protein